MRARLYDGRTAAAQDAELSLDGGVLVVTGAGTAWRWPLTAVEETPAGRTIRLAGPEPADARVLLDAADWRTLLGAEEPARRQRSRRRELKLVGVLTAAGAALTALVFWGIPAASGPLARATPMSFERQIGDNLLEQVEVVLRPCKDDTDGAAALTHLGRRLAAGADRQVEVRLQAVRGPQVGPLEAPFVNALALPGGAVLVSGDLIDLAETPDELAAVVAHEIAHVERRHAMQAVWRGFGAGLFLDLVVGGGSGAGQQAVLLAGSLTDQRFSRAAEAEADARGMALLHSAGLSSRGMAAFFNRLADKRSGDAARTVAEWMTSHPDTLRRVTAARAAERPGASAMSAADWSAVQRACDKAE